MEDTPKNLKPVDSLYSGDHMSTGQYKKVGRRSVLIDRLVEREDHTMYNEDGTMELLSMEEDKFPEIEGGFEDWDP